MKEVPILLYHNIGSYRAEMMEDGLSTETFAFQMSFLSQNGYSVVTLNQAVDHLIGKRKLPPKSIAITIDDGYEDALTNALPILKKHHFPATFFIVPESIGGERSINGRPIQSLNWNGVAQIIRSGHEIGLLAYSGRRISDKTDEGPIKESIANSMELIKRNSNIRVRYCAFTEGVPGESLWNFLQGLGLQAVFTQCPTNQAPSPAGIGRIQIDDDDHNIFLTKISDTYLFFKDKPSWEYVRRCGLDRLAHHISEAWNNIRANT
jgi:peptidoglycan/xylan/chitin deacetylase (PgdA/CDA1 family)